MASTGIRLSAFRAGRMEERIPVAMTNRVTPKKKIGCDGWIHHSRPSHGFEPFSHNGKIESGVAGDGDGQPTECHAQYRPDQGQENGFPA